MKLKDLTEKLISESEACLARFEQLRVEDRTPDFFEEVKPHVAKVDIWISEWKQEAECYIRLNRPKYIHQNQIDATEDGMKQYVVQSFFKETSKKRFYQSVHAVLYTLKTLLTELEREGNDDNIPTT